MQNGPRDFGGCRDYGGHIHVGSSQGSPNDFHTTGTADMRPEFVHCSKCFALCRRRSFRRKARRARHRQCELQSAPALDNPVNDVTAISVMLEGAGFQVVETRSNLDNMEMRRAIRDFSAKTRDADVAVVFYAGHGLEVDGTNYLIERSRCRGIEVCCRAGSPSASLAWHA